MGVVLELRNRLSHSEVIEKDRQVLIRMAKLLKVKNLYYEQFDNDEHNRNETEKQFNFNTYLIQSHANENADEIDYLMLFVLAECENVESSIKFEFFDSNSDFRMDISLNQILRPFLANVCEGLRDKPKIVMIHAPEKERAQPANHSTTKTERHTTPNHADFYICISRPKKYVQLAVENHSETIENNGTEPRFLLLLYSILYKFPDYEINQVILILKRELLSYHERMAILHRNPINRETSDEEHDDLSSDENLYHMNLDHSPRLWNCSRLRKKMYLLPQAGEETEQTSGENDRTFSD